MGLHVDKSEYEICNLISPADMRFLNKNLKFGQLPTKETFLNYITFLTVTHFEGSLSEFFLFFERIFIGCQH